MELPYAIDQRHVEQAHAMALEAQRRQAMNVLEAGMRLAHAKHPKLLAVLDQAANVLDKMADDQYGQTRRSISASRAEQVTPTETSLWREAYKAADQGAPLRHFGWIYGAAAWLAGLHEGIRVG